MTLAVGDMNATATRKPKRPPRKEAKNIGKSKTRQAEVLAIVRAENPTITAHDYAARFNLTQADKLRLQGFALEYLKDYNVHNAAMRLGYPDMVAASTGNLLLNNCYTQLLLSETMKLATVDSVVSVQQVVGRLWEEANAPDVAFSSNASTRISALGSLAKILRLGESKPVNQQDFTPSGVMVVPIAASPEEWGAIVQRQQRELKASTYIDAEIVR